MVLSLKLDSDFILGESTLYTTDEIYWYRETIRSIFLTRLPTYEVDQVSITNMEGCDKIIWQELLYTLVRMPLNKLPENPGAYVREALTPSIFVAPCTLTVGMGGDEAPVYEGIRSRKEGDDIILIKFLIFKGVFYNIKSSREGYKAIGHKAKIYTGDVSRLRIEGVLRYRPVYPREVKPRIIQYNHPVVKVGFPEDKEVAIDIIEDKPVLSYEGVINDVIKQIKSAPPNIDDFTPIIHNP